MAENSPNLKVNVTADTSQFSKGMKAAKADLKDFEKVSGAGLDSIARAFGVNTGKIEQMQGALRGLGHQMSEAGGTGAAAFGKLLTSVSGVAGAFAGIGIGAIVAGFADLNREADNFKQTVAGANMEMATAAYIDTYRQVIHDMNKDTGKAVAETESKWKEFWGTVGANFKAWMASGAFTVGGDAISPGQQAAFDRYNQTVSEANDKAEEAKRLQNDIYRIQREQSDNMVKIAELDAQIAEQKRIAYDSTESTASQAAALAKTQELIKQKYALQVPLAQDLAKDMEDMNALAESTPAQIDAANKQRAVALNLEKQRDEELRALSRRESSVLKTLQQENAELAKIAASREEMAISLPKLDASSFQGLVSSQNLPALAIPVSVDEKDIIDISTQLESLVSDLASVTGENIGQLVGDLMTGGDAWGNFANNAMSAFGDMAMAVGKMAIQTGVATLGIKKALESLNGWVAIAAGTALVALGSAVKTGLSNVASGNYSAGAVSTASTASYSAAMSSSLIEQSDINVTVTGTLKASGSQLVAVINNDNKRRSHTT